MSNNKPTPKKVVFRKEDGYSYDFEGEEPIRTHKLPSSDISEYSYKFSNGKQYRHPVDRGIINQDDYHQGFTDRDRLLDDAINRGRDLDCTDDLWRVYDDAVLNYGLDPINPYEWLFKHATLTNKSIIISQPCRRILLMSGMYSSEYYIFIHGIHSYMARYSRPVK